MLEESAHSSRRWMDLEAAELHAARARVERLKRRSVSSSPPRERRRPGDPSDGDAPPGLGGETWFRRRASRAADDEDDAFPSHASSDLRRRGDIPGPPLVGKVTARSYEVDRRGESRDAARRERERRAARPRPPRGRARSATDGHRDVPRDRTRASLVLAAGRTQRTQSARAGREGRGAREGSADRRGGAHEARDACPGRDRAAFAAAGRPRRRSARAIGRRHLRVVGVGFDAASRRGCRREARDARGASRRAGRRASSRRRSTSGTTGGTTRKTRNENEDENAPRVPLARLRAPLGRGRGRCVRVRRPASPRRRVRVAPLGGHRRLRHESRRRARRRLDESRRRVGGGVRATRRRRGVCPRRGVRARHPRVREGGGARGGGFRGPRRRARGAHEHEGVPA